MIELKGGKTNQENIEMKQETHKNTEVKTNLQNDLTKQEPNIKSENELDSILNKIENLQVDKLTFNQAENKASLNEKSETMKRDQNVESRKSKETNYFASLRNKEKSASKSQKTSKAFDENRLKEIKAKILDNMKKRCKYQGSKEISIEECFNILREHEKKIKVSKCAKKGKNFFFIFQN